MWNGLGCTPSLFQTVVLIDAACNHESLILITLFFHTLYYFFNYIIAFIPGMEISLILCLCFYVFCRRGNNHFDVHFRRMGPVLFPVERRKSGGP